MKRKLSKHSECSSGYPRPELANPFPLIINDVPPPPLNNKYSGGQKIFIIRVEYLLKGFGRAAFKFLLKSIKIKYNT